MTALLRHKGENVLHAWNHTLWLGSSDMKQKLALPQYHSLKFSSPWRWIPLYNCLYSSTIHLEQSSRNLYKWISNNGALPKTQVFQQSPNALFSQTDFLFCFAKTCAETIFLTLIISSIVWTSKPSQVPHGLRILHKSCKKQQDFVWLY